MLKPAGLSENESMLPIPRRSFPGYRLLQEYGASCAFVPLSFFKACWITGDKKKIDDFVRFKQSNIMEDKDGNLVYLAQSEWFLNTERQNNPDIEFHFTSEFKTALAQ